MIVGEDNTGKLDLGIFIASIIPDGPADRDGRIKPGTSTGICSRDPYFWSVSLQSGKNGFEFLFFFFFAGGRLISLNKISLEGVTFTDAAAILQSSPDEVELIVSQPKREILLKTQHSAHPERRTKPPRLLLQEGLKDSKSYLSQSTLGLALERGFGSQTTLSGADYRPVMEELEEAITLSSMATPKQNKRLHIPVVRIHDAQVRTSAQFPIAGDAVVTMVTNA